MAVEQLETCFASAPRRAVQEIQQQQQALTTNPLLAQVLDAMPQMVAVLNQDRQIVLANQAMQAALATRRTDPFLGSRPGEALACIHAEENPGGCGTSEACRNCGAVLAVLAAQAGKNSTQECFIQPIPGLDPLDLRVTAHHLEVDGGVFTIVSVQDIAKEKRAEILERTFFHDILNTAGGVMGLATLLDDVEDMEEVQEYAPLLIAQSEQMVSAIEAQRDMLAAERGQLKVSDEPVGSLTALRSAMDLMKSHDVSQGKTIARDPEAARKVLNTGKALLQRTLVNMLKNALEASAAGKTVTLGCTESEQTVRFWVHNEAVIPHEVQLQIFKRSFSTKGEGRGIGTYSMKLLGEKYLGGKVGFTSNTSDGTTFWLDLPTT